MEKTRRKISFVIVLIALTIFIGIIYLYLSPGKINIIIQHVLQKSLHKNVSIGSTSFQIAGGPIVELTNVHIGSPDDTYLESDSVRVKIAPWYMFIGKIVIKQLTLENPKAVLQLNRLRKESVNKELSLPELITIERGSLTLLSKNRKIAIHDINGFISGKELTLKMGISNGTARIYANQTFNAWKGNLQIQNVCLDGTIPDAEGSLSGDLSFDLQDGGNNISLAVNARGIRLPWYRQKPKTISFLLNAKGDRKHYDLHDLSVRTPDFEITGSGQIMGLDSPNDIKNADLRLDMKSNEFSYEEVVRYLPASKFSQWLSVLLTRQIRDGKTRFQVIQYEGKLKDLVSRNFHKSLIVKADLLGQSFGTGLEPERITAITGQFISSADNIELKNLSGHIGTSQINSVNLKFRDVARPGFIMFADVNLDMNTSDFVRAWRTTVIHQPLRDTIQPLSMVQGGRIRALTQIQFDSNLAECAGIQGEIQLKNSSFSWGNKVIKDLSGSARAKDFQSSIDIDLSGICNDLPVKQFAVSLDQPLGKSLYRYSLKTSAPLDFKRLHFDDNSSFSVSGSGKGHDITGNVEIESAGFKLYDTHYRPAQGLLRGRGKLKATLWSELAVDLDIFDHQILQENLVATSEITYSGTTLSVTGKASLDHLRIPVNGTHTPLKGKIDGNVSVDWKNPSSIKGSVICNNALIFYKNVPAEIDGSVTSEKQKISSKNLRIRYDGTAMNISGELLLETPLYFKGTLSIDGIKVEKGKKSTVTDALKGFRAKAHLNLTNMNVYGIPVDRTEAEVTLGKNLINIRNITMHGETGSLKGSTNINPAGESNVDVAVSLVNADIRQFYNAVLKGEPKIEGYMNVTGRLWGTTDALNGDITFSAKDGNILKYSLLAKIFSLLNAHKIISGGGIDFLKKDFSYNSITSTFKIRKGIINFDDFFLSSNSIQISAVGTYNINQKNIDAVAGVQPFEVIDKTISHIPLLRWVINGKDKQLIVVPVKIVGTIDNPSISIAAIDTISEAVSDILFGTLKVPRNIIERTKKLVPGIK